MTEQRSLTPAAALGPQSSRRLPGGVCGGVFLLDACRFRVFAWTASLRSCTSLTLSFDVDEMETSAAFGFGFRCGFLDLFESADHPEERLERELTFDTDRTHRAQRGLTRSIRSMAGMNGDAQPCLHAGPEQRRIPPHRGTVQLKATILVSDEFLASDPETVRGAARDPDRPHLCRQPRHGGRKSCRRPQPRWCSISDLLPEIDEQRLRQLRRSPPHGTLRRRSTRGPRQDPWRMVVRLMRCPASCIAPTRTVCGRGLLPLGSLKQPDPAPAVQ